MIRFLCVLGLTVALATAAGDPVAAVPSIGTPDAPATPLVDASGYKAQAADRANETSTGTVGKGVGLAAALRDGRVPAGAPTEVYKGVTLVGSWFPKVRNKSFFRMVKKGIDMTQAFSAEDRKRIGLIKHVVYLPPHPDRPDVGVGENIVGVYTVDGYDAPGYMSIFKDMRFSAPYLVAMSLLGNSFHAEAHERIRALARFQDDPESKAEAARLRGIVEKTDRKAWMQNECRILKANVRGFEALDVDPRHLDALKREMGDRGCW